MRIDTDIKLDFDDVLIRPKRSHLNSRSEVVLERTFTFPHAKKSWTGVPIIAANMDGVGTFKMAEAFSKFKMLVALHKFNKINDYKKIISDASFVTIGITDKEVERLKEIAKIKKPEFICIDAAIGYTERFANLVR